MTEKRIIDLETRIAFLEDTVNSLNTAVYRQQQQIDKYQLNLQNLNKHLTQLQNEMDQVNPKDEVPPHY